MIIGSTTIIVVATSTIVNHTTFAAMAIMVFVIATATTIDNDRHGKKGDNGESFRDLMTTLNFILNKHLC